MEHRTTAKNLDELLNKHKGEDIYVVGTGPSFRVFPADFFADKIVIGLNMAWREVDANYSITIHPDLNIPRFMKMKPERETATEWIVGNARKAKALLSEKNFQYAIDNYYFFEYEGKKNTAPRNEPSNHGRVLDWVRKPSNTHLYVWSSISQAGANLAANMGARNVILVGCDNCSIRGNHHSTNQHTRWQGREPDHRYDQYYQGLAEIRTALRERNVNLLSMNPFLALDRFEHDYKHLCGELGVKDFIANEDISENSSFVHKVASVLMRKATKFWGYRKSEDAK